MKRTKKIQDGGFLYLGRQSDGLEDPIAGERFYQSSSFHVVVWWVDGNFTLLNNKCLDHFV